MMDNNLHNSCEDIDASVFSSDLLCTPANLEGLESYIERWQRAIDTHKALTVEYMNILNKIS